MKGKVYHINWIPVWKELPEHSVGMLLFADYNNVWIGSYNVETETFHIDKLGKFEATHWAYLPQPPNED